MPNLIDKKYRIALDLWNKKFVYKEEFRLYTSIRKLYWYSLPRLVFPIKELKLLQIKFMFTDIVINIILFFKKFCSLLRKLDILDLKTSNQMRI